jgi:hypothetical protein
MRKPSLNKPAFITTERLLIAVVLLVIAGLLVPFISHHNQTEKAKHKVDKKLSARTSACNTLNPLLVAQLFNGNVAATKDKDTKGNSNDIQVTSCSYITDNPASKGVTATMKLRSPQTTAGVAQNKKDFESAAKQKDIVQGYGDMAFWDPSTGELNILKRNIWYTVSFGSSTLSDHSLDQTKKLADAIKDNLQ